MSAHGGDFAKGTVVTFALTGVGFIFGGWVLGVICLFVAVVLSLVLWTPLGEYLGFHSDETRDAPALDPCRDLLILLRGHASQLAWNLEHFWNWSSAIKDPNFKGKLPDGYGPTTHADAMETLLFMFGQFFSTAWTYQTFCLQHPDRAAVKALVDEVYWALGKAGDPQDLADARIGSDQLHLIGERSTREWGTVNGRSAPRSAFRATLEYHADAFEPLKEVLYAAARDASAQRRLDEAGKAARRVEEWLKENGYE